MSDDVEMSDRVRHHSPLYLFACHLEWRDRRNVAAYQELVAALDDPDDGIRAVAEALLKRKSPRRQADQKTIEAW